jgi:hemolysin activation/secretion protein
MLDNYGSRYTGINRMSFYAAINEPGGLGDRLSVSGMLSAGAALKNARVAYGTLLKPNGLTGEIAFAQTQYSLGEAFANLDAYGMAKSIDATLSYPIKKTRNSMVDLEWGVSAKDLKDVISAVSTRKKLWSTTAGLSLRQEGYALGTNGVTQANVAITLGELDIRSSNALAADAAGAKTQGAFSKLVASVSRVALLPKDFTLTGQLRVQQSLNGKTLDASEQMGVSGANGVMAYPSGELSGSNAIFARVELSHPLPSIASAPDFTHQGSLYSSWGQASQPKVVSATDRRREVSDVGLSWTGNFKSVAAKVTLAHRLQTEAPTSEPADRNRLLAQLSWVF